MLDLSIVIVNYRCWDKLAVCLKSIKMQSVTIRKVIVVDNFSNDGELEIFSIKFNWVHFIKEQVNGGFSYGCNIGAQYANTKWILFLNPDTKIPKTCFENLIPFCDNNPDYRLISINQLGDQGKQTYPFGIFPNFLNVLSPIRSLERILFRPSQSKKVISQNQISFPDWISGSFILIRNDDFTKIGEWDESFWMYYEDIDLCKRAQNNQMKCVMLNQWSCIHSHGGASRKNIDTRIKTKSEVIISSHKYAEKHFKGIGRFIAHILIFISSIIELFIFSLFSKVKRGMFFVMLRYWFLKTTSVK
jgi:GT2 family glycosyltransferase